MQSITSHSFPPAIWSLEAPCPALPSPARYSSTLRVRTELSRFLSSILCATWTTTEDPQGLHHNRVRCHKAFGWCLCLCCRGFGVLERTPPVRRRCCALREFRRGWRRPGWVLSPHLRRRICCRTSTTLHSSGSRPKGRTGRAAALLISNTIVRSHCHYIVRSHPSMNIIIRVIDSVNLDLQPCDPVALAWRLLVDLHSEYFWSNLAPNAVTFSSHALRAHLPPLHEKPAPLEPVTGYSADLSSPSLRHLRHPLEQGALKIARKSFLMLDRTKNDLMRRYSRLNIWFGFSKVLKTEEKAGKSEFLSKHCLLFLSGATKIRVKTGEKRVRRRWHFLWLNSNNSRLQTWWMETIKAKHPG